MHGISVFAGMGYTLSDNLNYMEEASRRGLKKVFTSLHIPEAGSSLLTEIRAILKKAKELDMELIVDVSKKYMDLVDWNDFNIHALRLDFGFTDEEICQLSKDRRFRIQLNASTITEENMENLLSLGLDTGNIEVCHNYYPRNDTGISFDFLKERNGYFHSLGMTTMAFIPSLTGKRGPIYEGLPTVEEHRSLLPLVSAQHLVLGGTDLVLFGDAFASTEEMDSLSGLTEGVMRIPLVLEEVSEEELRILSGLHHNRKDPASYVIRSEEARPKKKSAVLPRGTFERTVYSVTMDNEEYLRYAGELQIVKKDLPADSRINVIGHAGEGALLIDLLGPGDAFEFYHTKR